MGPWRITLFIWATGFTVALVVFAWLLFLKTHEKEEDGQKPPTPKERSILFAVIFAISALWFVLVALMVGSSVREWLMFRRYERWLDTEEGRKSGAERYGRP